MSDSVRPHRRQPTRLLHHWDSPGKNTGVGCHFLLQCMKVKSESEVAQSCPTIATPWTAAHQAPPSMGFSRQEYWSGVPLPSQITLLACGISTILWKILKEMGMPDHLTCLLKNLYAGQEATVTTGHGTTDGFQIGKGVHQAVYCYPAYLTYMQSTS